MVSTALLASTAARSPPQGAQHCCWDHCDPWEGGFDVCEANYSWQSCGCSVLPLTPLQCPQGFHPGPRAGSACAPSHRLLQEVLGSPQTHRSAQEPLCDACPCGCHCHQVRAGDNPLLPGGSSVCAPCVPQLTLTRAYLTNNSTSSDPEALPEAGLRRDVSAQKGEAGKKPQANVTFEKARVKGAFW